MTEPGSQEPRDRAGTDGATPRLAVRVGALEFKNPVLVASGTFGYGREYAPFFDLGRLGGVVVKGVSTVPWRGNPPPRIVETPAGMLNAIGLENPGVDYFIEHDLKWLAGFGVPIVVNVIGRTEEEYALVAARLEGCPGVSALELNISCPNIKEGGIQFGHDPVLAERVTARVRRVTRLPLWVKLSPNVTDIGVMAQAVEAGGADAISLINTVLGMAIDVERGKPVLANVMGGLSGPAIRPIAVRLVWQAAGATRLPIVGMGGIQTGRDAVEFMMAGASAVQVGTASFVDPLAPLRVLEQLDAFCQRRGLGAAELTGLARPADAASPPVSGG